MSYAATKNDTHGAHTASTATPKAGARAAAPRDAAADAQKMLLMLAEDWLDGDRTHAAEIRALHTSLVAAVGPPVNVDVPYASQAGATLACTMGNWQGEPTAYAYQWYVDGVAREGATSATVPVTPEDSGHSGACVVTATNAHGDTVAPMSNAVTVA